ncbi:unnamed protein product [Prorocentrum cordatum]|uniref:PDZ domain-containing protein n=1 Tax=Prorocentrum cordatum TaxID=2364126 RepID=A0ABN9SW53_9DINO|nr:unnamed protein product [Polarella glacialis]
MRWYKRCPDLQAKARFLLALAAVLRAIGGASAELQALVQAHPPVARLVGQLTDRFFVIPEHGSVLTAWRGGGYNRTLWRAARRASERLKDDLQVRLVSALRKATVPVAAPPGTKARPQLQLELREWPMTGCPLAKELLEFLQQRGSELGDLGQPALDDCPPHALWPSTLRKLLGRLDALELVDATGGKDDAPPGSHRGVVRLRWEAVSYLAFKAVGTTPQAAPEAPGQGAAAAAGSSEASGDASGGPRDDSRRPASRRHGGVFCRSFPVQCPQGTGAGASRQASSCWRARLEVGSEATGAKTSALGMEESERSFGDGADYPGSLCCKRRVACERRGMLAPSRVAVVSRGTWGALRVSARLSLGVDADGGLVPLEAADRQAPPRQGSGGQSTLAVALLCFGESEQRQQQPQRRCVWQQMPCRHGPELRAILRASLARALGVELGALTSRRALLAPLRPPPLRPGVPPLALLAVLALQVARVSGGASNLAGDWPSFARTSDPKAALAKVRGAGQPARPRRGLLRLVAKGRVRSAAAPIAMASASPVCAGALLLPLLGAVASAAEVAPPLPPAEDPMASAAAAGSAALADAVPRTAAQKTRNGLTFQQGRGVKAKEAPRLQEGRGRKLPLGPLADVCKAHGVSERRALPGREGDSSGARKRVKLLEFAREILLQMFGASVEQVPRAPWRDAQCGPSITLAPVSLEEEDEKEANVTIFAIVVGGVGLSLIVCCVLTEVYVLRRRRARQRVLVNGINAQISALMGLEGPPADGTGDAEEGNDNNKPPSPSGEASTPTPPDDSPHGSTEDSGGSGGGDSVNLYIKLAKKTPVEKSGATLRNDGVSLEISELQDDGFLREWNRMHPGREVQVGDRIVSVNGISGSCSRMRREFQLSPKLDMTIHRASSNQVSNVVEEDTSLYSKLRLQMGYDTPRREPTHPSGGIFTARSVASI